MRLHIMNHFKTKRNFVLGANLSNAMAVPNAVNESFAKANVLSLLNLKAANFRVSDTIEMAIFKTDDELFLDIPQGVEKNVIIDGVLDFLEREQTIIARILHFLGRIILGSTRYDRIRVGIVSLIEILFDRLIFDDRNSAITHIFERGLLNNIEDLSEYENKQGVVLGTERFRLGGEDLMPGMDGFTRFANNVESVRENATNLVSV